ncbi:hypothetical protein HME7025_01804 [Aquirufa nivalisilvae]|uniref:Secreted protein n=1 Tax=Aquirufa nivalisilvae TaxID=2516557 RepID=A0A2S2DWC0_9BACT|nr:hypothetical protein [Aquirufa nivalisilvae]AWL09656.1 hypothetical protein HME7025_01804 [Aquirufa nivalisilvae]
MKRIIAILLLIAIQLPLMSQWASVAYYQVNRNYIAKNLCENRDKPKLNCNGQCYLAKKLKAAEDKEQKTNSERLEKMPEIQLACEQMASLAFQITFSDFSEDHFSHAEMAAQSSILLPFHPPQCS